MSKRMVHATVSTYNPEHYTLHNSNDGTVWHLVEHEYGKGGWSTKPKEPLPEPDEDEDEFDEDGYPTQTVLRKIRNWEIKEPSDVGKLLDFVGTLWRYPDYWSKSKRCVREFGSGSPLQRVYEVSTGGWSGNESLISALEDNWMAWTLSWWSSRRGGHLVFHVSEGKT